MEFTVKEAKNAKVGNFISKKHYSGDSDIGYTDTGSKFYYKITDIKRGGQEITIQEADDGRTFTYTWRKKWNTWIIKGDEGNSITGQTYYVVLEKEMEDIKEQSRIELINI